MFVGVMMVILAIDMTPSAMKELAEVAKTGKPAAKYTTLFVARALLACWGMFMVLIAIKSLFS